MSINSDPEVYKFLIGSVMGLLGILNATGIFILNGLKKADEELFRRMREIEKDFSELQGEHKVHHGGGK